MLGWPEKSIASASPSAFLASSPKSNSSFQLLISSSRTSLSSAVNGQPALDLKPSSGPILWSRKKVSTSGNSKLRPAGILVMEKPQPSEAPSDPVQLKRR